MTEAPINTFESAYDRLKHDPIIPESIRTQWIQADHKAEWMTREWQKLIENEDLTQEARVKYAQEVAQNRGPQVEKARKELRQSLLKSAASREKLSRPTPKGQGLEPKDTNELIAAQNSMFAMLKTIEKRQEASSKGPFGFSLHDYLKGEYSKGLEEGGVAGAARCRGALMVSEDQGLDDSWLPREDKHHEYLDEARRLYVAANSVSSYAPTMPRSLQPPRLSRRPERRRDSGPVFITGGSGTPMQATQPSHSSSSAKKRRSKKKAG